MRVSNAELKALVRNAAGGAQVNVVYPDTLLLSYTTHAGYDMTVKADYKVTAAPQAALVGKPKVSPDTVRLFVANGDELPDNYTRILTEPIRLVGLENKTCQTPRAASYKSYSGQRRRYIYRRTDDIQEP